MEIREEAISVTGRQEVNLVCSSSTREPATQEEELQTVLAGVEAEKHSALRIRQKTRKPNPGGMLYLKPLLGETV